MLGCFNPNLGQIWTNPNVGLTLNFNPTIGFVHIGPKFGLKQPSIVRVYKFLLKTTFSVYDRDGGLNMANKFSNITQV